MKQWHKLEYRGSNIVSYIVLCTVDIYIVQYSPPSVARAEDPVTENDPGLASRGKTTADRSPNFRPPRSPSRNSDTFLTIVPLFPMPFSYC